MAVARKLFRISKSLNEYVNIKKFLAGDLKSIDKYLSVATRLAFLFYWIFDNIGILIKIKLIARLNQTNAIRRANKFWLIGLTLGIIHAIRNLMNAAQEQATLIQAKATMDDDKLKIALNKIKQT